MREFLVALNARFTSIIEKGLRQTVQPFLFIPESSISVQGQGASRYGRGKAACSPRDAISTVFLACVAGPWK